jgi:hypothetical protein
MRFDTTLILGHGVCTTMEKLKEAFKQIDFDADLLCATIRNVPSADGMPDYGHDKNHEIIKAIRLGFDDVASMDCHKSSDVPNHDILIYFDANGDESSVGDSVTYTTPDRPMAILDALAEKLGTRVGWFSVAVTV